MSGLCLPAMANQGPDIERVAELFEQLEEEWQRIPRTSFDAQAVVELAGTDPDGLAGWVRTHTHSVPYRGALRGHRGVLLDRVGNSLDRSLLLSELLRVAGVHSRLVRGTLDDGALQRLLSVDYGRLAADSAGRSLPHEDRYRKSRATQSALSDGATESELRKLRQSTARLLKSLQERTDRQSKCLLKALQLSGGVEATGQEETQQSVALRDHWWVQWDTGSEWRDLDPAIPVGHQALVRPHSRLEVKRGIPIETVIPAALRHRITIRVFIEQAVDEELQEREILHEMLTPFELNGAPVILSTVPAQGLDQILKTVSSDALQKIIARAEVWETSLQAGDQPVKRTQFDRSGNAVTSLRPGSLGGALAGFNPLRSSRLPQTRNQPTGHLTAQWVEYRIHVPGRPDRVIRRDIFDHIGPFVRSEFRAGRRTFRNLQISGSMPLVCTDILPLTSNPSIDWIEYCSIRSVLDQRQGTLDLLRGRKGADIDSIPFSVELMSFAAARFSPGPGVRRLFLAEPNIISFHRQLQIRKSDGGNSRIASVEGYDIVWNAVAVAAGENCFQARLTQGVRDTNLEALLMQNRCGCSPDNASVFTEQVGRVPDRWTLLRSHVASAPADQTLEPDIRQRIQTSVRAGWQVLAPVKPAAAGSPAQAGWWQVDPDTGTTLGMGAGGWGQSTVESILLRSVRSRSWRARRRAVHCLMNTVATNDRQGTANYLLGFLSPHPLLHQRLSPLLMRIYQEANAPDTLLPVPD